MYIILSQCLKANGDSRSCTGSHKEILSGKAGTKTTIYASGDCFSYLRITRGHSITMESHRIHFVKNIYNGFLHLFRSRNIRVTNGKIEYIFLPYLCRPLTSKFKNRSDSGLLCAQHIALFRNHSNTPFHILIIQVNTITLQLYNKNRCKASFVY